MKPDKLFRFFTPRALDLVEELVALGERTGLSALALAYGFLLAEPALLSVISGAMSGDQVRANVAAATAGAALPADVLAELRTLAAP
jgi:aryl-alcohol dehydrogenase-like predicted oxidoreductase